MNARELLNRWLVSRGYRIERTMPIVLRENIQITVNFDFLIRCELARKSNVFTFVQIGANDGVSRKDDLVRYIEYENVRGVLVEPQPDLFQRLEQNLGCYPGLTFINKAVHRNKRSMTLYRLDLQQLSGRNDLPHWARTNGIASFDRQHVIDHAQKLGLGEESVESRQVDCLTLDELLDEVRDEVSLLKIDTEGYDYEILDTLDFERRRPTIIHFEHRHMGGDEYESIIKRMASVGYRFLADKMNTTAYRPSD